MTEVAYQGAVGAFSEDAAIALCGEAPRLSLPTFADVFSAITSAKVRYGVVPIENTLAGPVHAVRALLPDVLVVGETTLRISHVLASVAGGSQTTLRRVRSHPMALAQCQRFFRTHPWIASIDACDTAGAIAGVVALGSIEEGAIGSRRAAMHHGATILATELEDDPANFTRFVLITAR